MTIEEMKARVLQAYPNAKISISYEIWDEDLNLAYAGTESEAWQLAWEEVQDARGTAKEKVLNRFPEAWCKKIESLGNCYVHLHKDDTHSVGASKTKYGETEEDAWLDALIYIEKNYDDNENS